jgi:hypothetical protein
MSTAKKAKRLRFEYAASVGQKLISSGGADEGIFVRNA